MSPQVKADGQMCHEEKGFCQDTLVFHSALLLTPSISLHIRQLVIWMGIQCTTLIITEVDERGINNPTQTRAKRERARGGEWEYRRERQVEEKREVEKGKQSSQEYRDKKEVHENGERVKRRISCDRGVWRDWDGRASLPPFLYCDKKACHNLWVSWAT